MFPDQNPGFFQSKYSWDSVSLQGLLSTLSLLHISPSVFALLASSPRPWICCPPSPLGIGPVAGPGMSLEVSEDLAGFPKQLLLLCWWGLIVYVGMQLHCSIFPLSTITMG